MYLYCPIREISVQRGGTRVKRFFVSEAQGAELENLTEARQSGAPGDLSGASFWYFLREKVLRVFWGLILFSIQENIKPNSIPHRGSAPQIPFLSPAPPKSPFTPFLTRGQGDLLAVVAGGNVKEHASVSLFICNVVDHELSKRKPCIYLAPLEKSQCSDEGRG
jgi:hypothetical protein